MGDLVEEHADLVVPRTAPVALDPTVILAWLVLADRARRALVIVLRVRAIKRLGALPLARHGRRAPAAPVAMRVRRVPRRYTTAH